KGSEKAILLKTKTDWLSMEGGEKICQDRRTIRLQHREDGSLILDFTIVLEASEGEVTIGDSEECALALRVMPTLRLEGEVGKGSMRNSEGVTGKEIWGKRASWVDYDGVDSQNRALGIAILDHPDSFRHPTWWHARPYGLFAANPFGQGHFEKTAAKNEGNHTIPKGDELTLRYRILIHPRKADPKVLQAEYDQFAAEE
ncbi:MAG: PmoA family protein, partial [Verrucomicrobiae bacterium]|nr:PmoA family protein [Verrucomicrobiae bacterium]